jgi:hypothetical protein
MKVSIHLLLTIHIVYMSRWTTHYRGTIVCQQLEPPVAGDSHVLISFPFSFSFLYIILYYTWQTFTCSSLFYYLFTLFCIIFFSTTSLMQNCPPFITYFSLYIFHVYSIIYVKPSCLLSFFSFCLDFVWFLHPQILYKNALLSQIIFHYIYFILFSRGVRMHKIYLIA